MKKIGITGLIASGKTTVSSYIKKRGYVVIDADEISRKTTKYKNKGYNAIVEHFGVNILNGDYEIDRDRLASIVFSDKKSLEQLNTIMHPIIFDEIEKEIANNLDEKVIFLDIPLLFETDRHKSCDDIILVYCDEALQLERIKSRDKRDEDTSKKIIASQIDKNYKIQNSSYIIENNSSLEKLYKKIDLVINMIEKR